MKKPRKQIKLGDFVKFFAIAYDCDLLGEVIAVKRDGMVTLQSFLLNNDRKRFNFHRFTIPKRDAKKVKKTWQ